MHYFYGGACLCFIKLVVAILVCVFQLKVGHHRPVVVKLSSLVISVGDPDPDLQDLHVFGPHQDPDPDPLVRGMDLDPAPDTSLFS
jgi:hypothetical protein